MHPAPVTLDSKKRLFPPFDPKTACHNPRQALALTQLTRLQRAKTSTLSRYEEISILSGGKPDW
jgi:hypothetical protein